MLEKNSVLVKTKLLLFINNVAKIQVVEQSKLIKTAIGVLIGGAILIFLATWVVPRALVTLTKAAPSSKYSISNSYLFGSPLIATANGEERIRINAFLLDDQGKGVPEKRVEVTIRPKDNSGPNASLTETAAVTDKMGKSTWEVFSTTVGQFVLSANIDGVPFPQEVTVTFR